MTSMASPERSGDSSIVLSSDRDPRARRGSLGSWATWAALGLSCGLAVADTVTTESTSFALDTRLTLPASDPGSTIVAASDSFILDTRLELPPSDLGGTVLTASDSFVLDTRLVVSNTDPVFGVVSKQRARKLAPWFLQLTATDAEFPRQALTYSKVTGPAGLTVSPAGLVTWTPPESDGGTTQTVRVQVSDGLAAVQQAFSVVVLEDENPPELVPIADVSIRSGQPWTATVSGSDPDLPVQALTYRLITGPDGLTLDPATV